ncbi:SDR family NAD(P)-dependent oxidoreductase [Stenotrophomonas sp. MMGLT7]|uniref:SDR family NAD(P)-dependent oxidoreductase n=1 Tax=Stenotrophomonas sp. MMGLT7 TaxID=2901227 RepID=UPI001E351B0C|nr:SDR family NAD(P)-dependent oxidoreductase [Stenotrophomonas sp. MMGLT7]
MTPAQDQHLPASALAGRVVLVAGATGGLGSAASLACAEAGATTVLLGRRKARLERLYDRVAATGHAPLLYPLDMEGATADDYAELAGHLQSELGRLDGLLHCAADFPGLSPLELADPAAFARALHVNLTARAWLTQACLPLLRRAEDSAAVFVLDDPARTDGAYWGGYGAAQAGLRALVSGLHAELAGSPVRVSALQPGPMRTALRARAYTHEEREPADPADYAAACVTLLSPAGRSRRGGIWSFPA